MDPIRAAHRKILDTPHVYDMGDSEEERLFRQEATLRLSKQDPEAILEWLDAETDRARAMKDTFLHLRGVLLKFSGAYDAAEEALREAVELRFGRGNRALSAASLVVLGQVMFDTERVEDAWTCFDQALALCPTLPAVHLNRIALADATEDAERGAASLNELGRCPGWASDPHVRDRFAKVRLPFVGSLPAWHHISSVLEDGHGE